MTIYITAIEKQFARHWHKVQCVYSGTSIIQTPSGPYQLQTVLNIYTVIVEVSLVQTLCIVSQATPSKKAYRE